MLITRIGYINEGSEILIEHENGYTTEFESGGWDTFQPLDRGIADDGRAESQPHKRHSGHRCCI